MTNPEGEWHELRHGQYRRFVPAEELRAAEEYEGRPRPPIPIAEAYRIIWRRHYGMADLEGEAANDH